MRQLSSSDQMTQAKNSAPATASGASLSHAWPSFSQSIVQAFHPTPSQSGDQATIPSREEAMKDLRKSLGLSLKDGIQSAETGTFVRIEDKFLLPMSRRSLFLQLVESKLERAAFEVKTKFTMVESIYFDSTRLDFLKDHLSRNDVRVKMRIRKYEPNGKSDEKAPSFIELKKKTNGITTKKRIWISHHDKLELMEGNPLKKSRAMKKLNRALSKEELSDRIQEINDLVKTYRLKPQAQVRYRRVAYEKDGIRLTMDSDIHFHGYHHFDAWTRMLVMRQEYWGRAKTMQDKFDPKGHFIVEVKHSGTIPTWVMNFMKQLKISKRSFSKYCWSMAHEIENQQCIHGELR